MDMFVSRLGSSALLFVLARLGAGATTSSSSSSSGMPFPLMVPLVFFSAGGVGRFRGRLSCVASGAEDGGGCVEDGFGVKKLEMLGCLRFRDGDAAEDGEECGAMMS
jgi:hypothetical protein